MLFLKGPIVSHTFVFVHMQKFGYTNYRVYFICSMSTETKEIKKIINGKTILTGTQLTLKW